MTDNIFSNLHRKVEIKNGMPALGQVSDSFGGLMQPNWYENSNAPEGVATPEKLKENAEKLRNYIDQKIIEKGGDPKEVERKSKAYLEVLKQQPLIHYTDAYKMVDEDGKNLFYGEEFDSDLITPILEKELEQGLISFDKYSQKFSDRQGNTMKEDIDIGRQKYVYFCNGIAYMGNNDPAGSRMQLAITVPSQYMYERNDCLVQNRHLINVRSDNNSESKKKLEIFELNETSLLGRDYLSLMALAIAGDVFEYDQLCGAEIMFLDNVEFEDIDKILYTGPESKEKNSNKTPKNWIRVSWQNMIDLQWPKTLKPDFSFKTKQPWLDRLLKKK